MSELPSTLNTDLVATAHVGKWHTFPIRCAAAVTSAYKGTCTVAATHPGCVLVTQSGRRIGHTIGTQCTGRRESRTHPWLWHLSKTVLWTCILDRRRRPEKKITLCRPSLAEDGTRCSASMGRWKHFITKHGDQERSRKSPARVAAPCNESFFATPAVAVTRIRRGPFLPQL